MRLHGAQGELNGVLLDDGIEVHLPAPEAARLAAWLVPDQTVYARGNGLAGPLGTSIAAQTIGPNPQQAVAVAAPPPGRHRRLKPDRWAGGAVPPPPAPETAAPPPAAAPAQQ